MKTGVWISLILLALTIGLGVWSGEEVRALSEEYVASAEELRTLAEAENWAGAEQRCKNARACGNKKCRGCKRSSIMMMWMQ